MRCPSASHARYWACCAARRRCPDRPRAIPLAKFTRGQQHVRLFRQMLVIGVAGKGRDQRKPQLNVVTALHPARPADHPVHMLLDVIFAPVQPRRSSLPAQRGFERLERACRGVQVGRIVEKGRERGIEEVAGRISFRGTHAVVRRMLEASENLCRCVAGRIRQPGRLKQSPGDGDEMFEVFVARVHGAP